MINIIICFGLLTAYEEVVCDSLETMLNDDKVLDKIMMLKSKDESIIKKIGEFFEKLVERFHKFMQQYPPETLEGKLVADMTDSLDKLQTLFAEALVDASNNYQAPGQKNTTSEGDVMFMARGNNLNIDKRGLRQDNISRANEEGDFINEFYNALNKSEWRVFYGELVKQGYIADTRIGTIAPIVVEDKLVIAERKYTTKDKHDYIVIDVYKLSSQDGDNYTLSLLQDALKKGDIDYDTQRIFSFVDRLNRSYGTNELLTAYNRSNSRYDITINNIKQSKSSSEIHRDSQEEIARDGLSLRDKPSIQKDNELQIKNSDRDTLGNTLTEAQQSYFAESKVRDENGNNVEYNNWESYELTSEFIKNVPYSERHTFLRSLANKTNGLEPGERKNIVIITGAHIYFYEASGYMNGSIAKRSGLTKKANAEIKAWRDYYDNIDTSTTTPYKMVEGYEGGTRRNDWDYDASQNSSSKRQNDEVVESTSESNTIGDTWGSNGDFETDEELIAGSIVYNDNGETFKVNEDGSIETIKFQDRDPDAIKSIEKINQQLAKENIKLIEDVKNLKELVKLQSKETHGKMLKKSTVELVAKRLMAYSGAKGNVSELASHLSDVYNYIIQGEDVSWESIQEKSQAAVDWLMQNENNKPIRDEYANEVLKHLRIMRVTLH